MRRHVFYFTLFFLFLGIMGVSATETDDSLENGDPALEESSSESPPPNKDEDFSPPSDQENSDQEEESPVTENVLESVETGEEDA